MKKALGLSLLNLIGVAAVFALLDLIVSDFNGLAFVKLFTSSSRLIFMGACGLLESVFTFVALRRMAARS